MSLRLSKYLKDLRTEAHRFERTDINNNVSTSFWGRNQRRIICILPSLVLLLLLREGFNSDFVAYASTVLSILIGLFTTAIIFILDKYQPIDNPKPNSKEKLWDTQAYNYTKQFSFITGYNIVLCVFALVLLSLNVLFEEPFSVDIYQYTLCLKNIDMKSVCNFLIIALVVAQRFLVIYWLASIIYNTLYVISSMVKYMTVKIDRK
ncbi:hypothetical protein D0T87_14310 [Bacteroides sp. 51]|nr:hypothetical protein [Bacteroides sp. 51]